MKKTYVLDTNVLLHDPQALFKFEDNDLVIPITVVEEIDGFNPGSEVSEAYVRDETMRHDVGLSYAASLARLGL